jgi:hypothetical protein
VTTLNAYGVNIVDVLTHWEVTAVAAPIHSARMVHFERDAGNPARCHTLGESGQVPLAAYLAGFDIVVNCVLQHTDAPLMFVTDDDLAAFSPARSSSTCRATRGWASAGHSPHRLRTPCSPWAATSITTPWTTARRCWNSATWEISQALLPHLRTVLGGPGVWDSDQTIRRAIEIRAGIIQNPNILSFQHRAAQYPHPRLQ